jgi:MFS transporter, ACS family, allantoate permease
VVLYIPRCDIHPCWWIDYCSSAFLQNKVDLLTDNNLKFGTIIIEGLGFNDSQTVLMIMPTQACILLGVVIVSFATPRLPNSRLLVMAFLDLIAMAGCFMIVLLPQEKKFARLSGLWLIAFVAPSWPLMLSIFASNTAGFTKKSTTSCILFIGYCVGNIAGPQFFLAKEAPHYEVSHHYSPHVPTRQLISTIRPHIKR